MKHINAQTREAFCPHCEDYRPVTVVESKETYTVRGEDISVSAPKTVCSICGQSIGTDEEDQALLKAVYAEYRRRADLLSPERIKSIRKRYRLSQKSFAVLLGMSEATINRYEQGGIQDPSHDTAIRAAERPEVMRELLERRGGLLTSRLRNRVQQALAGQTDTPHESIDPPSRIDRARMPGDISLHTGYRKFNYRRFASTAVWFCRRLECVSRTTINKLLFYADFLNYKTSTVSLTGAAYRRLPYGPAPADYGGLLSRMEAEEVLVSLERNYPNGYTGFDYSPGPRAEEPGSDFTDRETQILECVASTLGVLTAKTISERSHDESAWRNTDEKQLISYAHAAELSLSLPEEVAT